MMVILCGPDRLPVHVCPVTFFPHLMLMPCYIRHRFFLKSSLPARIHRGAGLWLLVGWILLAISGKVAFAQETNIERYQAIAVECVAALPDTPESFRLDAADRMPYLRPSLVQFWQSRGHTVYLNDSTTVSTPELPLLAYRIEEAGVEYNRRGRSRLQRVVTLALQVSLRGVDNRLLYENRCRDRLSDVIPRGAIRQVETSVYPETQAPPPEAGWVRRYLEPVVLTAATAVGIYLFFSIRSGSEESP
jgi:hypothetical protein